MTQITEMDELPPAHVGQESHEQMGQMADTEDLPTNFEMDEFTLAPEGRASHEQMAQMTEMEELPPDPGMDESPPAPEGRASHEQMAHMAETEYTAPDPGMIESPPVTEGRASHEPMAQMPDMEDLALTAGMDELPPAPIGRRSHEQNLLPLHNGEVLNCDKRHYPHLSESEASRRTDNCITSIFWCLFLLVVLCVGSFNALFPRQFHTPTFRNPPNDTSANFNESAYYPQIIIAAPAQPFKRFDITTSKAACWPSRGGVWIKPMTPVELSFIGLDRFNDSARSYNPADEDTFCQTLRRLGAQRYDFPLGWPFPDARCTELDTCVDPVEPLPLALAFAGNDTYSPVWVLNMTTVPVEVRGPREGALKNALSMTDRCTLLEKFGAKYCARLGACEETTALVD
ncbi:MAG: hypothetical protein M1816_001630 [Peltula sp. TS41687]|nr:MAG: hypothetical protein M1816_001630 [Peltula sp. TS41687]